MANARSTNEDWNATFVAMQSVSKVVTSVLKAADLAFADVSPVYTVPPVLEISFKAYFQTQVSLERTKLGESVLHVELAIGKPVDTKALTIAAAVWVCDAAHAFVGTVVRDADYALHEWPGRVGALKALEGLSHVGEAYAEAKEYVAAFDCTAFVGRVDKWLRRAIQDGVGAADADGGTVQ